MNVIEVNNLTKDYGNNKGIFELNFAIEKGTIFGYLGPNGAGKTTTIRHLMGFLNPHKGSCFINGKDCRKKAATIQSDVGYLPGEIAFFEDMTGAEFLKFMSNLRNMKKDPRQDELTHLFELDINGKIKRMSKGMKQKLGLVCAFMHDPQVLILDEPTAGLDPLMQNIFVDLVLEEKRRGKTILMSSHSFEEVSRTCDKIGIIKEGRLVAVEDIETLKSTQRKIYRILFNSSEMAEDFSKEKFQIIAIEDSLVDVSVKGDINLLIKTINNYHIIDIDVISQSLEELFMHYYGGGNID